MNGLVEQFCDHHHAYNDISRQRRVAQRRVLDELVERVGGVDELEADALRRYLATLVTGEGMKATTVAQRLTMVRPFIRWLREQRHIDAERMLDLLAVKPPRGSNGNGQPKPYSRKQIEQMWADLDVAYPFSLRGRKGHKLENAEMYLKRWQEGRSDYARVMALFKRRQVEAVIHLALYGGIRREEIFRLELDDMHHDNAYVVVRSARKNPGAHERVRVVPMGDSMRAAIKAWLDLRDLLAPEHDCPWLSLHGEPHARKPIRFRTFGLLLQPLGIEYHRLRHTYATFALQAGMPAEKLMKILGHSKLSQTLGYAKIGTEDVLEAAGAVESKLETRIGKKVAA